MIVDYQKQIGAICARDYKGISDQCVQQGKVIVDTPDEKTTYALRMRSGCNGGGKGALIQKDKSGTLATGNDQAIFTPVQCVMATQQGGAEIRTDGKAPTLTAAAGMSGNNQPVYCAENEYTVRRLTPLECERLQGFPDGWTDIGDWTDEKGKVRKCTDSARYKALGNSIALPPWFYILSKLSICCGADHTMGSLFDGIGGFPLIWETLHGAGSCLWASEIEGFPIAVTKIHFPEVTE